MKRIGLVLLCLLIIPAFLLANEPALANFPDAYEPIPRETVELLQLSQKFPTEQFQLRWVTMLDQHYITLKYYYDQREWHEITFVADGFLLDPLEYRKNGAVQDLKDDTDFVQNILKLDVEQIYADSVFFVQGRRAPGSPAQLTADVDIHYDRFHPSFWQNSIDEAYSGYDFFWKYRHLRDEIPQELLPLEWQTLYRVITQTSGKSMARGVNDQEFSQRLLILSGNSNLAFYSAFRSFKNDGLLQRFALEKLTPDDIHQFCAETYVYPSGNIIEPRYKTLKLNEQQAQHLTVAEFVKAMPEKAHIDFYYPLVELIYKRINNKQREALGENYSREIAIAIGTMPGRGGNNESFRSFFDLYRNQFQQEAIRIAEATKINRLDAFRFLAVYLFIESRGFVFSVSPKGALGPFQHTYYFYLLAQPPTNPFDPVASMRKNADRIIDFYRQYKNLQKVMAAFYIGETAVGKSIDINAKNWKSGLPSQTQKYIQNFEVLLAKIKFLQNENEIIHMILNNV